jgi:hypothetical protein
MPCTLTGSLEGDRAYLAEENRKELEKKVSELNNLLCTACQLLEAAGVKLTDHARLYGDLGEWWKEHQKVDEKQRRAAKRSTKRSRA